MKNKNMMPPPWLAFRDIERFSIGWRMGYGEDYIYRFGKWFDELSYEEQREYRALFPEPATWKGWWDNEVSSELLEHNDFLIDAWQPKGLPKYNREWLLREIALGKEYDFCFFWGHHPSKDGSITKSCFSQWWMEDFYAMEHSYICMEQYMMASKALLFGDEIIRKKILNCNEPQQIKKLGRKVHDFEQNIWDRFKYSIVLNGNWLKFSQNKYLREFLLSTENKIIVEASPYDDVWGICLSETSPDAMDPFKWRGENLLGFALMEVRDELHRVTKNEWLCDWNIVRLK